MPTYGGLTPGGWSGGAASDWAQPSDWAQGGGIYGWGQPQQSQQAYQQPAALAAAPAPANQANLSADDFIKFLSGGLWGGKTGGQFGGAQNITQTINPWAPQGKALEHLYNKTLQEYNQQMRKGPVGFSDESKDALQRMENMARQKNPLLTNSLDAVNDISSGGQHISGNLYSDLWRNPGTSTGAYAQMAHQDAQTGLGRYMNMYNDPSISQNSINQYQQMAREKAAGTDRFAQMAGENPITGIDQYNKLAAQGGITGAGQYQDMANEDAITNEGMWRELQQRTRAGAGSLERGMYGELAKGEMVNSNPYREQAIKQSMGDTAAAIKASMSSKGRYGSDAYGDAMGKGLSSVATQARMQGYDTDTANMMAAAQARSGEILARQGQGLQVAQGISGLQGANQQQRLAALQGMTGAQNAAAQNQLAAMGARGQAQLSNQQSQFAAAQALANTQQQNQAAQLAALSGMTGAQQARGAQQFQALQGYGQAQSQNMAQRLAALQGLTSAQGQNVQQRLAAAQGMQGVQGQNIANRLAAAGMAPQMNDLRYADMNRLLGVGQAREAMAQQQRNFGWDQLAADEQHLWQAPRLGGAADGARQAVVAAARGCRTDRPRHVRRNGGLVNARQTISRRDEHVGPRPAGRGRHVRRS